VCLLKFVKARIGSRLIVNNGEFMENQALVNRGLWSRAEQLAIQTPDSRNRYVDFLRALSILAVISGHWLMAAPHVIEGGLAFANMLDVEPWTRWLTWGFQVMPIFFLVGGYANGVSWDAAIRDGSGYNKWFVSRLARLIIPVLPLVLVWIAICGLGNAVGVQSDLLKIVSQGALVPIWFLSVYILVVLLVPISMKAWKRYRMASFWFLVLLAVVDDVLFFAFGLKVVGWFNYAFVWLAVHQLGYAWRDGYLGGMRSAVIWMMTGALLLVGMVIWGPYPISMVSVPGDEVSNTLPPKFAMLALGMLQIGVLLGFERPVQHWLTRLRLWTATIVINGMIMTIYLWHLTASMLMVGLALLLGNIGLEAEPGSILWWVSRPIWFLGFVVALALLMTVFGGLETRPLKVDRRIASWRLIVGALTTCGGLALLALNGVVGSHWFGLQLYVLCLPFIGAAIAGVLPMPKIYGR
jgi:surface polysaccharide O-acyltransferase-like enzyme